MKRYESFDFESGDVQCLSPRLPRDYAEDPKLSPVPEEVSFLNFHNILVTQNHLILSITNLIKLINSNIHT